MIKMKWDKDLSAASRSWMMFLGNLSPTVNPNEKYLKGLWSDGNSTNHWIMDCDELRKLAKACDEAADWLEKRALLDGKNQ